LLELIDHSLPRSFSILVNVCAGLPSFPPLQKSEKGHHLKTFTLANTDGEDKAKVLGLGKTEGKHP
jgi:hypothetical protein